ncbi:Crp/Fnr family transcriptional regulator [Sphingobacterium alkalisoli]|uniref:Crp/Fnr family transcriptional regulator n=1 Tax=Sphingobacterium alkalisoli TaxID=1874115 RepID=A0A4U0H764_9SPHI|nr:Crp/Fnr family transcriptional regulator [Sphingobacterium alkalisoli]TJY67693.1 Crp/Fnr family transcriptional regulator [Sphingobacterium alkalisoli]
MRRISRKHRASIQLLLQHWGKFGAIQPFHEQWATEHTDYHYYTRKQCIYEEGWTDELVFYVCSGMVARITMDEENRNRNILSVGLPRMALFTTEHLYSQNQGDGKIVALRPSAVLIIPYRTIKIFKEEEKSLDTLMDALTNKKKRQLARLRKLSLVKDDIISCYTQFTEKLPELYHILSHNEQKDLLGLSRSSVQRADYFLLTGKNKQKKRL